MFKSLADVDLVDARGLTPVVPAKHGNLKTGPRNAALDAANGVFPLVTIPVEGGNEHLEGPVGVGLRRRDVREDAVENGREVRRRRGIARHVFPGLAIAADGVVDGKIKL